MGSPLPLGGGVGRKGLCGLEQKISLLNDSSDQMGSCRPERRLRGWGERRLPREPVSGVHMSLWSCLCVCWGGIRRSGGLHSRWGSRPTSKRTSELFWFGVEGPSHRGGSTGRGRPIQTCPRHAQRVGGTASPRRRSGLALQEPDPLWAWKAASRPKAL